MAERQEELWISRKDRDRLDVLPWQPSETDWLCRYTPPVAVRYSSHSCLTSPGSPPSNRDRQSALSPPRWHRRAWQSDTTAALVLPASRAYWCPTAAALPSALVAGATCALAPPGPAAPSTVRPAAATFATSLSPP